MRRLEVMARASTHGGYDSRMTSDPLLVSKAVFEWWWLEQDNRGAMYRRMKAGLSAHGRDHDTRTAKEVLQVQVGALNMDNIGFEELVAHREKGPALLDLVTPVSRRRSQRQDSKTRPFELFRAQPGSKCRVLSCFAFHTLPAEPSLFGSTRPHSAHATVVTCETRILTAGGPQGLEFVLRAGETVRKACSESPIGQAIVGCAGSRS